MPFIAETIRACISGIPISAVGIERIMSSYFIIDMNTPCQFPGATWIISVTLALRIKC